LNIKDHLPDLKIYQKHFTSAGVRYPLNILPFKEAGLLKELPKTNKEGWPWDTQTNPNLYDDKKTWPKITIVTPSYNQGRYLEETIRSVLLQNYPNLEYIVMDGGSSDETKQILEKYAPWISYWQSKKDNGQGQAINLGFSLASGSIYGWINSDDFYMESAFLEIEKGFRNSKIDLVYGDGMVINEQYKSISYQKAHLVKRRYLFIGGIIMQHSCFWRSEVHEPILEKLSCAVDSELWFRIIPDKQLKHIKFPLAIARIQPEAKTHNKKYEQMWKEDNQLIDEIHQFKKKIFLFKYFLSRFYKYEIRIVHGIYRYFNKTNKQIYTSKIKGYQ
jgi:glycosyltransferase involved in cell wall biosynthesis